MKSKYCCLARFNSLTDCMQIRKQFLVGFLLYIMGKILGIFKLFHNTHIYYNISKYLKFSLLVLLFLAFFSSSALALQQLITQEVSI